MHVRNLLRAAVVSVGIGAMSLPASAAILAFDADDPSGDHLPGAIDVTGLHMVVDSVTGEYRVILSADEDGPFVGTFNVEFALGGLGGVPVFVFDLSAPTTTLSVGPAVTSAFEGLVPGDEVFVYGDVFDGPPVSLATGRTPDGVLPVRVRLSEGGTPPPVLQQPGDFAAIYDTFETQTVSVSAVPLPAAGWAMLGAVSLLAARVRRREHQ